MCGHFEARLYLHLLNAQRQADTGEPRIIEARKVAPSVSAPILVYDSESRQTGVAEARFGLVPFWYKGALRDWKASTFNARLADTVQIGGVWTPRALRGRGHARAVAGGSLLAARAAGVSRAVLFTPERNHAAQRAYESLGFRPIGDYSVIIFAD